MENNELTGTALWYYNLSVEDAITVCYQITMKDEVDGEALRKAVDVTMSRYPYLKKRLVVGENGYSLVDNDAPIVVRHTHHVIPLCGSEANWHQFALSYSGPNIFMSNTHAIFDGRGRSPMLHTLMYYYCKFRYDEEPDMPGVILADTPIDPREYEDPYVRTVPEPDVQISEMEQPKRSMHLADMGLVYRSHIQIHRIGIDEKALMNLCRENDGTPNSVISLLMCRAIARVHPDSDMPITAGVYCDVRSFMKSELSHITLVTTLELEYDREMRNLPFSVQDTIFRGKMLLASDPANLYKGQLMMQRINQQINALPTLEQKKEMARDVMHKVVTGHTFSVSYSGKGSFGSCDKHIRAAFPSPQAKDIGILIEITVADGKFDINFIQEWKEDVYFDAFLKELRDLGLDYDLLYSAQHEQVNVSFD